jgi:peroxiredoxin
MAATLLGSFAACGGGRGGTAPGEVVLPDGLGARHPNVGRLAPNFAAQDNSGRWLPLSGLQGKPMALLFFRSGAPGAAELIREFARFRSDPEMVPTDFFGLDLDSPEGIDRFARAQGVPVPILRDPGSIAPAYGVSGLPTVVLLDADHIIRFQLDGYVGRNFRLFLAATEAALKKLPTVSRQAVRSLEITYTEHPRAPVFTARDLGGRQVDLASLHGHVVVLIFFDQECPHCKKDLPRLAPVLREARARGVVAYGITSRDLGGGLRRFLQETGIDFPVVLDADRTIFAAYDSTRTPDMFLIDRDGFIRFREQGDRPDRAELTGIQLRVLIGGESPGAIAATLPKGRYLGDETCRACHAREYKDWLMTPHSIAWDSLQPAEKFRDPACVACHVTGPGRPGGFVDTETTAHLVNVQCEVCHGPGGGHADGGARVDLQAIGQVCASCHSGKFVLNFKLDEALSLVSHRDHPDLDRLFRYSELQRSRLEEINTRRLEKFKSGVAYVGAASCRDCHREEYDQWNRTKHASAFAVLLQARRSEDRTCAPCHTTGMGHKGGFGEEILTHGMMTNVQCEVCHGPGEDHLKAPPALKKETIYGITDQCSFCIIQGVCMTCHDHANDPHFDIERALPLVRHRPAAR